MKRIYLAVAILLFGAPAMADSTTVNFTGTSTSFCTMSNNGEGVLAQSADSLSLSTQNSGGSAASFSYSTNSTADLDLSGEVAVVSEPSGFTAVRTQSINVVDSGSSVVYSGDGTEAVVQVSSDGSGTVDLEITDSASGILPPGSYSYEKVITCTPTAQ